MAYRIIWSSQAVDDVEAIATYIARDSPSYAAAVVKKILDTVRTLEKDPDAGRTLIELTDSSIREQFAYSYRIIYQTQEDTITIAAVIHGKRLLDFGV
ncbi:MAG: type II toxin-antitoxin system RelE/ParE family toxin [Gomphosphaeria aponina SAG 52.96 = DSM 107014]|uniref:Type II toxin-antitoxin system RelE/ParE family toxin n=1 Tax=Gomphosphaeria aponina SAG 52.96 = DSM 107014 TaxID=1521640 RepID=A0A941GWC5_9CHRO|nr:type II toxin-antitoxin system RelE/ParE family toxin [Gomphosphaeria aponina SAG 52.96 = DSM 107014]